MRSTLLLVVALAASTTPVHSQALTKSECDEAVMAINEISRTAAGLFIHVENINVAPLRVGADKVMVLVERLEEAREHLLPALSEFALAAKDLGQVVPAMCPP